MQSACGERDVPCDARVRDLHQGLVACIATGPSLTRADCDAARKAAGFVIAINDAWRWCPDADVIYACDPAWWRAHGDEVRRMFHGERWTQNQISKDVAEEIEVAKEYGLRVIEGEEKPGLGRTRIHYGSTSGYQAINLAYLWGARRVVLLGYDYQVTNGMRHFFGDHPKGLQVASRWPEFAANFNALAADLKAEGVEVVNCSRASALQCFPRSTVDALPC